VSTSRLETFADGVFAIAATLLILDVSAHGPNLGHSLLHIWPSYVGYAVSFITIGIMWVNHHTVFEQIERVDRRFLFINIGLLMCIAFVPFPTRLVALHIRDEGARAATLTYGLTLTITAIFFSLLWFVGALRGGLLKRDADPRMISGLSRSYWPGSLLYLAATLVALASPQVSAVLFMAIGLFYVVESSIFGRA
jgi:TMEM175 potassium channel family protein